MTDRTTKLILAAIALGLWTNAAMSLFQPIVARADDFTARQIMYEVSAIANGTCVNHKIC